MTFKNIIQIWKAKGQIIEGITNSIFKREDVEEIAKERLTICIKCKDYDTTGDGCYVSGTQPCCSNLTGGCGCSIKYAIRSLSKVCPKNYWGAELTEEEEEKLKEKISY